MNMLQLNKLRRIFLLQCIVIVGLTTHAAFGQTSGPVINVCSSEVVDQQGYDEITETVCLIGNMDQDQPEIAGYVYADNSDGDFQYVAGLEVAALLEPSVGDPVSSEYDAVGTNSIGTATSMPAVTGLTYQLTGTVGECIDSSGTGDTNSCSWNYDFAEMQLTGHPTAAVDTPANLTATASSGQVALTWSAVTGDSISYLIFKGTASGGESALVYTGNTSYTVTGLTNGITYYFKIKAMDGAGAYSEFSNEVSAVP